MGWRKWGNKRNQDGTRNKSGEVNETIFLEKGEGQCGPC